MRLVICCVFVYANNQGRNLILMFGCRADAEFKSNECFFYTDKATNPLNKELDWDSIKGFYDQLNDEPEG